MGSAKDEENNSATVVKLAGEKGWIYVNGHCRKEAKHTICQIATIGRVRDL